MEKVPVKLKLIHPDAKMPAYMTDGAAGFDLYSIEDCVIQPGKHSIVGTGIAMEIKEGFCWQLWGRGGLGAKGIGLFAGLIDSDYRGEFKVILYNSTSEPYKVCKGDRIVQVVVVPIAKAEFEIADNLSETKRGEGRFHSTGKN